MSIADVSDKEILEAVSGRGSHGCMTYVAANVVRRKHKDVSTPGILRRLKKLEKQGLVSRVRSCYAVQICWAVVEQQERERGEEE